MTEKTLHATSVIFCGRGILIRGASGCGKSDLALRLIDAGGMLIADDRTAARVDGGKLLASPPAAIAGLLEIRGIGLRRLPYIKDSRIDLCLDLGAWKTIPRMPENLQTTIHGVVLPCYTIDPFEPSAIAKIRALLHTSKAK